MTPEEQIERWFRDLLVELDPRQLTRAVLMPHSKRSGEGFAVDFPGRDRAEVPVRGELLVVAIGKAAIAMAEGAQDALGEQIARGHVLTVDGPDASGLDDRWTLHRGGHPIPDDRSIRAAREIVQDVQRLDQHDVVLALISGGGSALFELPREPLTLADFADLTRLLLNAGAPIQHLNTVRTPLSQVKGGAFRRSSPAGRFVTLILSDVLGNDPRIIASGPTVEPAITAADARAVLDRYDLVEAVSPGVRVALADAGGQSADWTYPEDLIGIVGDNELARRLAGAGSVESGFSTVVLDDPLEGEASELARRWVGWLRKMDDAIDVVWGGGEATVTVRGAGLGGRNTEFALAAALELERLDDDRWVIASLATDGQDGSSDSAGAIASGETIDRARSLGLDPNASLAANDSASLLGRVDALVITGPSGTNVNDLYVGKRRRLAGNPHS